MVIISTSTEEVSIQAVSPVSILGGAGVAAGVVAAWAAGAAAGAAAAGAAAAGAPATGVWAIAGPASDAPMTAPASASPASLFNPMSFISRSPSFLSLERRGAGLAGADAHGVLDAEDEDLAVADVAGGRRGLDRLDRLADDGVVDHRLQLHLGQEVHLVLRAPVDLGLPLLPAVALHFRDGQPLDAGADERFAHVVQLE